MLKRVRDRSVYFFAGLLFSIVLIGVTLVNLRGVVDLSLAQLQQQNRVQEIVNAQRRAMQMQVDFKIQVQEWKNVLIRGNNPEDFERYFAQFREQESRVQNHLNHLLRLAPPMQSIKGDVDALLKAHQILGEEYRAALKFYDQEDSTSYARVDRFVRGIDRQPQQDMELLVDNIRYYGNLEIARGLEDLEAVRWRTFFISFLMVGVGLVLTAVFLYWLYQNYRRLNEVKEEALAASRAKTEFLANVSHEIRTPLNGVIGMLEVLQTTELEDTQQEYVEIINASSQTLLAILNDLLDYSKIEARKIDLEPTTYLLESVVQSVVDLFKPRARAKGIELRYRLAEDVPTKVECDEIRFRQILLNLVFNSVKFTEKGYVEVRVNWRKGDNPPKGELLVEVEDSGIGIEQEIRDHLFEPFNQADTSTTRQFGGTGLGLTISRNLTELMGGEIGVESEPGQGSIFHFSVQAINRDVYSVDDSVVESTRTRPAVIPPKPVDLPAENMEVDGARILLAEDNPVNAKVALLLLKRMGFEADVAVNGEEAVKAFRKKRYHLVLMDMQMPVMDGVQATQAIRELTGRDEEPWIMALTAGAMQQNREQAFSSGFNDFITKPINFELFREKVSEQMAKTRVGTGA